MGKLTFLSTVTGDSEWGSHCDWVAGVLATPVEQERQSDGVRWVERELSPQQKLSVKKGCKCGLGTETVLPGLDCNLTSIFLLIYSFIERYSLASCAKC